MSPLDDIAQPFIDVAHRIVWATVATIDPEDRPRSRVLHPIWEWDGSTFVGWIATSPTPIKIAHLAHRPFASVNYWDQQQDMAYADKITRVGLRVWDLFEHGPEPVGYDPRLIPVWTEPTRPEFAVLRLDPWRLRVFPGSMLGTGQGEVLDWHR